MPEKRLKNCDNSEILFIFDLPMSDFLVLSEAGVYAIPVREEDRAIAGGGMLLFSPLSGYVAAAERGEVMMLQKVISGGLPAATVPGAEQLLEGLFAFGRERVLHHYREPGQGDTLSILPNQKCNFSCSYCYSAKGRSDSELSPEALRAMLKYFIDPARIEPCELNILIAGGGEPMLSWPLISAGLDYAADLAAERGFKLYIRIITNGSILNEEIIRTLLRHRIRVCVSFEILEELQQKQRGAFRKVHKHIRTLISRGIIPEIFATITPAGVERMEEMLEAVHHSYPEVKKVNFDPVMDKRLFTGTEDLSAFYRSFVRNYFRAWEAFRDKGLETGNTILEKFSRLRDRFCPGYLCLTAEGTLSLCHKVSSPSDPAYDRYCYGSVILSGKPDMDQVKFDRLLQYNAAHFSECNDCFARWHCGGGCLACRDHFSGEQLLEVCNFHRDMLYNLLIRKPKNQRM
ncbi:MAG: radical SAM protein [Lentimicrobium sp.]|nr:radical SAM protein [Lentimicrobium sp.]